MYKAVESIEFSFEWNDDSEFCDVSSISSDFSVFRSGGESWSVDDDERLPNGSERGGGIIPESISDFGSIVVFQIIIGSVEIVLLPDSSLYRTSKVKEILEYWKWLDFLLLTKLGGNLENKKKSNQISQLDVKLILSQILDFFLIFLFFESFGKNPSG